MYKDELNRTVAGLVYVSTFQLRFYPERHVKIPASFFRVPLATIARIEVPEEDNNNNTAATSSQIHLFCKDGVYSLFESSAVASIGWPRFLCCLQLLLWFSKL